jgi:hypothetical protein
LKVRGGRSVTAASWLNLVEGWFALLTAHQIRRGTFRSTRALEQAIRAYIASTNQAPKPFVWTKSADDILARPAPNHTAKLDPMLDKAPVSSGQYYVTLRAPVAHQSSGRVEA